MEKEWLFIPLFCTLKATCHPLKKAYKKRHKCDLKKGAPNGVLWRGKKNPFLTLEKECKKGTFRGASKRGQKRGRLNDFSIWIVFNFNMAYFEVQNG
jgi:hypothetical protein